MSCRFCLPALFAAGALALTATGAELTLADAIARTLRDHPGVKIERENTARAAGVLQSAAGQFDSVLLGGFSPTQTRTPAPPYAGPLAVLREDSTSGFVALAKTFRSGVVVTPRLSVFDFGNNTTARSRAATSETAVEITVPLQRGSGRESAGANEAAARAAWEAQRLAAEYAIESRVFATVSAYWASIASRRNAALLQEMAGRGREVAEIMTKLHRAGLTDPATLRQATAQLNDYERRAQVAETISFQARQTLGLALGLSPAELAEGPAVPGDFPATELRAPAATLNSRLVTEALRDRRDLASLQKVVEQAGVLARKAERDLRPQVDFGARVGYAGGANDGHRLERIGGSLTENLTGWNTALSVSVAWPLANNVARGALAQQRAAQRAAELNAELASRAIASSVLSALERLRSTAREHELAALTAAAFRFAADREIERARLGDASLNDVIDVELRQSSARLEEIEARRAYLTALAQLRLATGTLAVAGDDTLRLDSRALTTLPP